ncbi:MAG: hypothetical protein GY852_00795 [bacterium]|nr:hypothetical protein [bacterium]
MRYLVISMILLLTSLAAGDWVENFDSYTAGEGLAGQGGWFPWENNIAYDAYVTTAQARSAANSLEIEPTSDIVQEFGIMSGQPTITAYNYIPSGSTGDQFFILLTVYMGPDSDWALQIKFNSTDGQVIVTEGSAIVPIVYDQWVEVKVEIDLGADSQSIYYNGSLLETIAWSPSSGIYQFGALDLFSDGGSSIYWDDITVTGNLALSPSTWAAIKTSIK